MKKIFSILVVLGVLATGCEDELTIFPEDSLSVPTFYKTEVDFEQAVNGAYAPLRTVLNGTGGGPSGIYLKEMHSDNTYYARNTAFGATEQQEDLADFAVPTDQGITTNVHVQNVYVYNYQVIARTNQILATIDEAEFDGAAKNNIKGQALFLRALAYFDLVQLFGSVPMHLVPVLSREDAALPLSSEDELYTQIISDASEAITLLPSKSQQDPGRATSGAARTLLANVHIVREQWAEAEAQARAVVESDEYMLMPDYADAFSGNSGNKNNMESVFEIQYKEGAEGLNGTFLYYSLPWPLDAEEVGSLMQTSNPQPLSGEGNNIPTPDILAAYEDGDLRKDASITYVNSSGSFWRDGTYPIINKFLEPHSLHFNHGVNWPVYRYSEVLLFLAEALEEQGESGEALIYLNQVRTRAGLGDPTGDLGEAIFNERRVELAFENKRWFDLVRTGRAVDVITAYGNRIKANPNDYYYPEGAEPRGNAFSNISLRYGLPASESSLNPNF
ncbi:RagB/SusD family nutrient uptake outer membrane protein [Euzebyella marina]|uniref:RagB/SusD family nutrient uptake outer membrane protein n=1 Tax=Euzebyella marina TaxID=1761453 RepID=A0A3G2L536_9FLAO|nr:RagB/SusD family nutrient uptake outer membrane protein [Euzebyella marina]AYN67373.1 RagB/SusD family nutrient uptake outer membrane protein [Euzebyella marina]